VKIVGEEHAADAGENYAPERVAQCGWLVVNHNCDEAGSTGGKGSGSTVWAITKTFGGCDYGSCAVWVHSFVTV
jgi:hypothetical protein